MASACGCWLPLLLAAGMAAAARGGAPTCTSTHGCADLRSDATDCGGLLLRTEAPGGSELCASAENLVVPNLQHRAAPCQAVALAYR